MDLNTVETVLIAVVPSVVSAMTIISGICAIFRTCKLTLKNSEKSTEEKIEIIKTQNKELADNINILKNKIVSIEKIMAEEKEKNKKK